MNASVEAYPPKNRGLFLCYLVLICWAPIPLGSNRPWSWAVLEIWVFALAAWWLLTNPSKDFPRNPVWRGAKLALLCGAAWLAYVWLQLVPLPMDLLRLLSPEAARWYEAAAWASLGSVAPLTLDQHGTFHGALKSTAYLLFFCLSLALLDRRQRIAAAAYTLVASGLAQAVYGAVSALAAEPGAVAHGSFVNRNHFAGYLEMCLAMGLGLLMASLTGDTAYSWRQFVRNTARWILSPRMLLRMALVAMVVALVLSRSRMGNTAFFVSMLVTSGIALLLARYATRSMVLLLVSLVIIDIVIVGGYFGVEQVVERIEKTELANERTESVSAISVWQDYPLFGAGLGSFHIVFLGYKETAGLSEVLVDFAHNDYIQFAGETGLIGVSLVGLLVLLSFVAALRAQQVRRDPLMRGISFGAMMGIIALMIHSSVDFNLQIPANALTFMLLLAMAWISLHHKEYAADGGEASR